MRPAISEAHPVEQGASMGCVTDRGFEPPMDGSAVDIKSYRPGGGKWDDGAVRTMECLVLASMVIGIHIELGKEGQVLVCFILILVAFDMFEGWCDVG